MGIKMFIIIVIEMVILPQYLRVSLIQSTFIKGVDGLKNLWLKKENVDEHPKSTWKSLIGQQNPQAKSYKPKAHQQKAKNLLSFQNHFWHQQALVQHLIKNQLNSSRLLLIN